MEILRDPRECDLVRLLESRSGELARVVLAHLYPLTVNARYGNLDVSNIIETLAIKPYYSGSYAKEWTFVSSNLDARTK